MIIDYSKTLKLQNYDPNDARHRDKHAIKLKMDPMVTITQDENHAVFSTFDRDENNDTITVYNISNASIEA